MNTKIYEEFRSKVAASPLSWLGSTTLLPQGTSNIVYYTLFASVQKYYKSAAATLSISLGEYNELWTVMKFLTKVDHLNNRIPHSIKVSSILIPVLWW